MQTGVSCPARNGRSPGEETLGCTVAARGKRRSRPLPTKAIDEAVGERGSGHRAQGDLARKRAHVQCPADWLCLEIHRVCLLNHDAHSADAAMDENAPSYRIPVGDADRGDWPQFTVQTANHSSSMTTGNAPIRLPVRGWRPIAASSGQVLARSIATDPAPTPRPALPDGALRRSQRGREWAADSRPLRFQAARRCSSPSADAPLLSVSPPSSTSAAPAAAGSGSSGASGSASQAARVAAATVAPPPRGV